MSGKSGVTCAMVALVAFVFGGCASGTVTSSGEKLNDSIFVTATIDGQPWVADSGTRNAQVLVPYNTFAVAGTRRLRAPSAVSLLSISSARFTVGVDLPLRFDSLRTFTIYEVVGDSGRNKSFVPDPEAAPGSVTIDGYDPVNRLISGHFHWRGRQLTSDSVHGYVVGGDSVNITNGRFRLPYTDQVIR